LEHSHFLASYWSRVWNILSLWLPIGHTFSYGAGTFEAALDDVKKAFKYYLKHHNEGRPFILAGHSQGSQHIANLVRYIESHVEEFSPNLLQVIIIIIIIIIIINMLVPVN
jgi:carboxypeptidase C (cathepsin A)